LCSLASDFAHGEIVMSTRDLVMLLLAHFSLPPLCVEFIQLVRLPFLLPNVNPRLRKLFAFDSSVGDLGLSLPDCDDDSEADRLRPSSARMSSRETFR